MSIGKLKNNILCPPKKKEWCTGPPRTGCSTRAGNNINRFNTIDITIKNEKGNVIQGSIAELKKVDLNGRKEWISIRGVNKDAPVLLFLAGGPGGTQMSSTRYELAELEKHFVVVNWDQPGSGKSFHCMNVKDIWNDK